MKVLPQADCPVDILMATFRGSGHLEAQIDSLFGQSYSGWRLIISDDGSDDGTWDLIQSYAARYPEKVKILENRAANLGPCGNFARLMECSTAPYVMFCDQDDIWFPDKIRTLLSEMLRLEDLHGKDRPLLVHSDLQVVDENLKMIDDSFWAFQNLAPNRFLSLNRLLVQNVVTGCATMINGGLRDLALPIPSGAVMHDWWVALVAAAFGKIGIVPEATLMYRQHGRNDIGAKAWNWSFVWSRIAQRSEIRSRLLKTQTQAAAFLECYRGRLSAEQSRLVEDYAELDRQSFWARRRIILRRRFLKNGLVRNVGLLANV